MIKPQILAFMASLCLINYVELLEAFSQFMI